MLLTIDRARPVRQIEKDEKDRLIEKLSGKHYRDAVTAPKGLTYFADNLAGDLCHKNYLDYLEYAWGTHHSVVMTPDILWYTLLCEIAGIVRESLERFGKLFTTTPGKKQDIQIQTTEVGIIPLEGLLGELRTRVPSDADIFLPDFSTTTNRARIAKFAAFADLVSPYYNYSIYLCGIPMVDVRGEFGDYELVAVSWHNIGKLLGTEKPYFARVGDIVDRLLNSFYEHSEDDASVFWKQMFFAEKCGSGGEIEVHGWFTDLFRNVESRLPRNFSTHVSTVKYTQIETAKKYQMMQGLFTSRDMDGLLEPDFGYIVFEEAT